MADTAWSPTSSAASEAGDTAAAAAAEVATPHKKEQHAEEDEEHGSSSPAPPRSAARPIKERHSLSLEQRRALRRWASSQAVRPSHRACIDWFRSQYNHTISQSTVSHSLSPKYARLDGDPQLSGSRLRFGNWPDVEKLVLLWHGQAVASGRHPTNDELADKAKDIFAQLPKYKGETPPEFSPGWIHRFKKRYGLLMRRQRRHASHPDPATDVPYLVDAVPRFLSVGPDTSPAAIRDAIQRVVGVEPTLVTCARVRDDIVRNSGGGGVPLTGGHLHHQRHQQPDLLLQQEGEHHPPAPDPTVGAGEDDDYADEDPEVVLQNALRALQQEEAEAEAVAAVVREARDRADRGLPPLGSSSSSATTQQQTYAQHALATTAAAAAASSGAPTTSPPPPSRQEPGSLSIGGAPASGSAKFAPLLGAGNPLTLTPIQGEGPASTTTTTTTERPIRCPFCVNQRMLRSIKEAVEHMSTHVVV